MTLFLFAELLGHYPRLGRSPQSGPTLAGGGLVDQGRRCRSSSAGGNPDSIHRASARLWCRAMSSNPRLTPPGLSVFSTFRSPVSGFRSQISAFQFFSMSVFHFSGCQVSDLRFQVSNFSISACQHFRSPVSASFRSVSRLQPVPWSVVP